MALMRSFVSYLVLFTAGIVRSQVVSNVIEYTVKGESFPSLIDVTLEDLTVALESGLFTSLDLVNAYLVRIDETRNSTNAVTEVNPDAQSIAAELDAERANGTIRGPLHGIPILIENNIATLDKMNTTAGSYALLGAKVSSDSTVALKLRAAGAIILGKANLSQWGYYRSTNSSNGWSAHGGQVYGAYYPSEDPSGSASGSAVASSIGLAFAALGCETDGSIISPAGQNALVGIKPTVGLTSRYLIMSISEHQDTVGPIARTVKDAAYILQQIAGQDPNDNYTSAIPNQKVPADYVAACNLFALNGARIGIPWNVIDLAANGVDVPTMNAFSAAITVLKGAGADIINNTNFPTAASFLNDSAETLVLNADFMVKVETYFSKLSYNPNNISTLKDVRAYTHAQAAEDWPQRNTAVWDYAIDVQGWNNTDPRFWPAYQRLRYYCGPGGLLGALSHFSLDAIILPTKLAASWAAPVGAPVVSVPMGFYPPNTTAVSSDAPSNLVNTAPNIPLGLSFLGRPFNDERLIGLAYAYEQRTKWRTQVRPSLVPSIELRDIVGP